MLGIGLGVLAVQQGQGLVDDGGAGLPAGAIAYADFKNGTYNYGGNTFADFLYENTDYGTWEGEVVPGTGFVPAAGPQNISIGAALTAAMLANDQGCTVVVTTDLLTVADFVRLEAIDLPDWVQDITAGVVWSGEDVMSARALADATQTIGPDLPITHPVKVAIAVGSEGALASINGEPATADALGAAFICNFLGFWIKGAVLETVTLYQGAKTASELEALSA